MQPFTVLTAVAAPLEIAKIDTGMILPGRYMRRHRRPGHDYGEAFLYDLRFDDKAQAARRFPDQSAGLSRRENSRHRLRTSAAARRARARPSR